MLWSESIATISRSIASQLAPPGVFSLLPFQIALAAALLALLRDTDGGGMPDAWETRHGLDASDPADASQLVPPGKSSGFMSSVTAAMPPGAGPPPPTRAMTGVMAASAIVGGGVALAYPLALIFVLMSRTVRDYYSATND